MPHAIPTYLIIHQRVNNIHSALVFHGYLLDYGDPHSILRYILSQAGIVIVGAGSLMAGECYI
jgi:hypothetical protein